MNFTSKNLLLICIFINPIYFSSVAIAQSAKDKQEMGVFLGKCYALGAHIIVNDSDASQSMKERLKEWTMKIGDASNKFISDKNFENISKSELMYLAKNRDRGYLNGQIDKCISVLGRW